MMTHQIETDTATEEREVLLMRAKTALESNDKHDLLTVRDQLREHFTMYAADDAAPYVAEQLRKLDVALGEESPDSYAYLTPTNLQ